MEIVSEEITEQTKKDGNYGNIQLFGDFRFISFVPLSLLFQSRVVWIRRSAALLHTALTYVVCHD
ncbi:MAG: hypothetical protein KF868_05670 [Acidobacteria bacterium]|nr:hypothetical protein [Acidobacteriota bacterium]